MYNLTKHAGLILVLAAIAVIYIVFRWLQEKRREEKTDKEDTGDKTIN